MTTSKIQTPTNTLLTFRAEFNGPVTGLDLNDFVVTNHSGTATGTVDLVMQSAGSSFPNPLSFSFSVTAQGSGSISLDLKPNAGLLDSAGHAVAVTGLAGEIISI